jgi:hypothetical protein
MGFYQPFGGSACAAIVEKLAIKRFHHSDYPPIPSRKRQQLQARLEFSNDAASFGDKQTSKTYVGQLLSFAAFVDAEHSVL